MRKILMQATSSFIRLNNQFKLRMFLFNSNILQFHTINRIHLLETSSNIFLRDGPKITFTLR